MSAILEYAANMLPYMAWAIPLIVLFRLLRIALMRKNNRETTVAHEVGLVLFLLFLAGLASQTVLPKLSFENGTVGIVDAGGLNQINIIPFQVFFDTYREVFENGNINYFIINFLGNIVMFMPIGFFLPALWRNMTFRRVTLIAASISLFIELSQLLQPRGTDIDDIWLNTLGGVLGYGITHLLSKHWPSMVQKCLVQHK